MNLEDLKYFFLIGVLLNLFLLFYSFMFFIVLRDFGMRMLQKFVKLPEDKINMIIYGSMGFHKVLIYVFFIVPYLTIVVLESLIK